MIGGGTKLILRAGDFWRRPAQEGGEAPGHQGSHWVQPEGSGVGGNKEGCSEQREEGTRRRGGDTLSTERVVETRTPRARHCPPGGQWTLPPVSPQESAWLGLHRLPRGVRRRLQWPVSEGSGAERALAAECRSGRVSICSLRMGLRLPRASLSLPQCTALHRKSAGPGWPGVLASPQGQALPHSGPEGEHQATRPRLLHGTCHF